MMMKTLILLLIFSFPLESFFGFPALPGRRYACESGDTLISSLPDYLALLDRSLYVGEASVRMEIYKNGKMIKFYGMQFYRRGNLMRMEFTEPAPEKGRKMLNDNFNLWMYLPRTSKVMKLPFKQSFMGSDASNRDLLKINFQEDYDLLRAVPLGDTLVRLELKARDLTISYNKVIVWFDLQKQIISRQEMYSLSGKLMKTMIYEQSKVVGGISVPSLLLIQDQLQKNTLTKMYYSNMKRQCGKPAEYFTLGSLKR